MLTIVLVLNFIACLLFSTALVRRWLPERPTPYVAVFESFVVACLLFSVEIWFCVEGLSLFNALKTPEPLAVLLFLLLLGFGAGAFRQRQSITEILTAWKAAPIDPFVRNFAVLTVVLFFLPLLFLAIFYAPCTADSMSYHLPRLVHWIQNGNVELYPSNYTRQIYYQPFADYLMLPWALLSGGDFFDNLVQYVALIGVLALTALLIQYFGGNGRCQLLGCMLVLSAPIVVFEAPTTQTDIVLTFFFFAFLYFGLKLSLPAPRRTQSETLFYAVGMAIALGLGLNTKLSVAAFEIPFCLWFGWRYLNIYRKKALSIFGILLVGFLVFNIPYFIRNERICGNIFGPAAIQDQMRNARFGLDVVFSNAVRNIGMQLRIPNEGVNQCNKWFLIQLHQFFGITWSDFQTSFTGEEPVPFEYETVFILDDYRSGNMLIIILFCIAASTGVIHWCRKIFLVNPPPLKENKGTNSSVLSPVQKPKKRSAEQQPVSSNGFADSRELAIYAWLTVFGFLLFSGLFRWQPFGARLLLPTFLGSIPFIAVKLYDTLPLKRINQFIPLLFVISFLYVLFLTSNSMFFNPIEPLTNYATKPVTENTENTEKKEEIGKEKNTADVASSQNKNVNVEISLTNPELLDEYFAKRPPMEAYLFRRKYGYFRAVKFYLADYISVTNKINELGYTKIGLALNMSYDRWEYPFWPLLRSFGRDYRIEWVVFPEIYKKLSNYDPDFVPELVITDYPPDVIMKYYEIEHVWKYEHFVLLKVKIMTNDE